LNQITLRKIKLDLRKQISIPNAKLRHLQLVILYHQMLGTQLILNARIQKSIDYSPVMKIERRLRHNSKRGQRIVTKIQMVMLPLKMALTYMLNQQKMLKE